MPSRSTRRPAMSDFAASSGGESHEGGTEKAWPEHHGRRYRPMRDGVDEGQMTRAKALAFVVWVIGCAAAAGQTQLANPASQHCAASGGILQIEQRPDGGQFGVCIFADNRQCEEWA